MKTIKKRISLFLCLCMVIPSILGLLPSLNTYATAEAATKTTINDYCKKQTIGIQGTTEIIWLDNVKDNATYTYTSSNTKIVKVTYDKSYSSYATLKGLKTGSATITVKQKYKNKTTKVGTVKVKVVKASVNKEAETTLSIGTPSWTYTLANDYNISNMNYKASYEFTSSDPDILNIKSNGVIVEAKAAGTVTVAVTETYKKKTRNLGNIEVTVNAPSLALDTTSIDSSDVLYITSYINNADNHEFEYTITDADGNDASSYIEKFYYEGDSTWYGGYCSTGTTGTIYIAIHDKTADLDIGTLTVNIVEASEY